MQLAALLAGLGLGLYLGRWLVPLVWSALFVLLVMVGLRGWPSSSRPVGLVARGLIQGLVALSLGGLLASSPVFAPGPIARHYEEETRFVSTPEQAAAWAGLRRLVVRNSAGSVTIDGGEPLHFTALYRRGNTSTGQVPGALLASYLGDELRLTGLEPSLPQAARRGVRATLHASVPRRVSLEFSGRIGDVSVKRLAAARLDLNVGDVGVREVAGAAVVSVDVGDVRIAEVAGGVEAQTQVGDLWLEPEPASAPMLARTDVGDITLVLPRGGDIRVVATSLSRELPPGMKKLSPTQGELVLGRGTKLIVLETRIGRVRLLRY